MNSNLRQDTKALVARYLEHFPNEVGRLGLLRKQLESDGSPFIRSNMTGHVTSSAAVLSPDGTKILLIHHAFLKKWLTPGGHYEGPGGVFESALREVEEETGVSTARAHPWTLAHGIPLDIDSHDVPIRPEKGEGPHVHHDFLFVAEAATDSDLHAQLSEVNDAQWVLVADLRKSLDRRVLLLHSKLSSFVLPNQQLLNQELFPVSKR